MVKVRFKQDRVVQDGLAGTAHETRFAAGEVVDLAEASANHWLARGVAERVLEEPATPPAETSTPGDDLFSRNGGAAEPDDGEPSGEASVDEGDGTGPADESKASAAGEGETRGGEAGEGATEPPATEPNGGKKRGASKAARI